MSQFYSLKKISSKFKSAIVFILIAFSCGFTQQVNAQDLLMGLTSNGGADGKGTAFSIKSDGSSFSIFKTFADWGKSPLSTLIKGADGQLYGTTNEGGIYGYGTIFKVAADGSITVLKNFDYTNDGGNPTGGLLLAKDGSLYGFAGGGTPNSSGCIYKLTSGGVYSVVRSFSINTDGGRPRGRMIQGTDGNIYGMTNAGGVNGYGTVFKLSATTGYSVLKSFNQATDGSNPYGSLIQAKDGNLYGTTRTGGQLGYGTIFKISTSGTTFNVLKSLNGSTEGAYSLNDLVEGKDGMLYGMCTGGGVNGNGTVYKISTSGSFTLIKALSAGVEGGNPEGGLIQASDGNFYGLTKNISGGFTGSIIKVVSSATSSSVSLVAKFSLATTGGYPVASLYQNSDGLLYGTTTDGGTAFGGTIFKSTTSGTITVVKALNGSKEGNAPQESLTLGKDSAYFGLANTGGAFNYGTVFKICGNTTTVIKSFNRNVDGGNPCGSLVRAKDGSLFGMTNVGGTNGAGTIFKVSSAGAFSVIKHLNYATDGGNPKGNLIQGADGALYGMTVNGGPNNGGTIFRITTGGAFSVLKSFISSTDGANPEGDLIIGKDGSFYGMTTNNAKFFKLTTGNVFSVLKSFNYTTEGSYPTGSLIIGTDGLFYGLNSQGGSKSGGTIFKIGMDGKITLLRHLAPATDGSLPKGKLVQGSDGFFYGVTATGGANKAGTIFRINSTGLTFNVLRPLNMVTDGGTPMGGLIIAPKINLVANPQSNLALTEDGSKVLTLTGSGAPNITFSIFTNPKNGTVTTGTGASRTYKPKANYNGKDSFAFTSNLGCLASKPAIVSFVISSVNDTPVLASIGSKTLKLGSTLTFTATATDVDAGQTKTFSLVTPPTGATITSAGAFSWKPAATGTYSIKVKVADNGSPVLSDQETVTVTVTAALMNAIVEPTADQSMRSMKPQLAAQVTLYPNPVVTTAKVSLSQLYKKVTVGIYDLNGRLVSTASYMNTANIDVDASKLTAGRYTLVISSDRSKQSLPFIKN